MLLFLSINTTNARRNIQSASTAFDTMSKAADKAGKAICFYDRPAKAAPKVGVHHVMTNLIDGYNEALKRIDAKRARRGGEGITPPIMLLLLPTC